MGDTEGFKDVGLDMLDEAVRILDVLRPLFWDFVAEGKLQRLVNGQSWEVDVV